MRTVRVIPCLDVDQGRVVKGVNFVGLRDAGDPVELASRYDAEGADEIVFLDITASSDGRETIVALRRRAQNRYSFLSLSEVESDQSMTPVPSCARGQTRSRLIRLLLRSRS